jgi:CubicO group peptidase (beta-lactamase class C family)
MKNLLALFLALLLASCSREIKIENELDSYMKGQHELFNFNGNVLITKKGRILYQKSFGFADFNSQNLLNDSSIFELASISKQFTAMGILILVEKDKIQLNDSLRKFFPNLPYSKITINHLLTHTSGLPDYADLITEKWDHSKIAFNNDIINLFIKERPLIQFNPGEKFEYSNTGYALLASIIENVSGKSYRDFMAENIFLPLNMSNSFVYNSRRSSFERIPNYAYGYVYSDSLSNYALPDSLPNFQYVYYLDGIQGDGCVNSTTSDLIKWDRAIKNCSLVNKETMSKMLTRHILTDTLNNIYYGFGLMVGKDDIGNYYKHSGGWPGYLTSYIHYQKGDISIIILSNNESGSYYISNSLANIIYNRKIIMPYKHGYVSLDSTSLDLFTGTFKPINVISNIYHFQNSFKLVRIRNKLYMESSNGLLREFKPESKNKVYSNDRGDQQLEFEVNANGTVKYFQILYGIKTEIEKIN